MKVTFRETGGFASVARGCELDTDQMPPADAAKLRSLIAESHVTSLIDIRLGGNDMRQLSIHIDGEGIEHSVILDAAATPDRLLPLVKYLRDQSEDLFRDDPPPSQ